MQQEATILNLSLKKAFTFPIIAPHGGYCFETLNSANAEVLYKMFKDDQDAFVDNRFKNKAAVKEYAAAFYNNPSSKNGALDWLFKNKDGYEGILHLYGLSRETFADNHRCVWIGFALKRSVRGKGIGHEVVQHFIHTLFQFYPAVRAMHAMTEKDNMRSQRFLQKLNFIADSEERLSEKHSFFIYTRCDG